MFGNTLILTLALQPCARIARRLSTVASDLSMPTMDAGHSNPAAKLVRVRFVSMRGISRSVSIRLRRRRVARIMRSACNCCRSRTSMIRSVRRCVGIPIPKFILRSTRHFQSFHECEMILLLTKEGINQWMNRYLVDDVFSSPGTETRQLQNARTSTLLIRSVL